MVPTIRLAWLAAVVGVAALFYPWGYVGGLWGTLAILNGILAVVAIFDGLAAPAPSRVEVARRHPAVVVLGATAPWGWVVTNPGGRRVRLNIADELAPSLGARQRRVRLSVGPHGRAQVSTELRPTRRGRFEISELVVRVEGPLGLMARQRRRQLPTVLRVHPPFRRRDEAELLIRRARILEVGMRSARGTGGGTEFEQLREYSADDEFRRIDWAATARTGRPIVRTYRPERNQNVVVLLDNGRLMAARVAGVPRIEHAMDATLMLGHVATRLGDRLGLIAFDSVVRAIVPLGRGSQQTARITAAMYALDPELAESDYQGAFAVMSSSFRRRSLIVVLSDLSEQMVDQSLAPALPLLVRHHLVIVGAVRDPALARWSTETPEDPDAAYRSAAAVAAISARERTAARLRGLGAMVLDLPPGKLAGGLTDSYLRIKSTGRL
jgi:uncharacterized protein (DUF58 family)